MFVYILKEFSEVHQIVLVLNGVRTLPKAVQKKNVLIIDLALKSSQTQNTTLKKNPTFGKEQKSNDDISVQTPVRLESK